MGGTGGPVSRPIRESAFSLPAASAPTPAPRGDLTHAKHAGVQVGYSFTLTGAVIGTFPILIVFILLGRQIIGGIMQGAVKG